MSLSLLARRYALAIFDLAKVEKIENHILNELRTLSELFIKEAALQKWMSSPLVAFADKQKALKAAFVGQDISLYVQNTLLLLLKRGRFEILEHLVEEYEHRLDLANGVERGSVRSAAPLSPNEQLQLEAMIEKVTKKKVILSYKQDPKLLGGLVARVGSFTFDDSIESHLRRMNEELKRSAH